MQSKSRHPYRVQRFFVHGLVALGIAFGVCACGGSSNRDQLKDEADAAAAAAAAAASAASAATTTAPVDTNTVPATVEVLTTSNTLPSAGSAVTLTAFIKNAANVGLAGKSAVFAASSGTLEVVSATSDAAGSVSAKLSAGSNKSLRDITVTVSSGAASGTLTLAVTDSTVAVSGSGSMQVGGAASTYTVRAADSVGNPVAGASVAVSSALGNAISLSAPTTGSTGTTSFGYTPTVAGADTLTVSSLGVQTKTTVQVNAIDFAVLSPASNTTIAVAGTGQTVTVRYKLSGAGVPGKTVTFSTTRGNVSGGNVSASTSTTDANGDASVQVSSTTAGPATVVAQIADVGQVSLPVLFTATTPSTVVVQSNPSAVQPNLPGSTTNQSTIEAVVRDANGNAVANTQVAFSVLQDRSNGTLSPGVALTDSSGRAQVQFIPGPVSTANDGVEIQASAGAPAVNGTAKLTVNGQALFITIAFGNKIEDVDTTTYTKPLTVYVTDANGVAVANQSLALSILPEDYDKGVMLYNPAASLWDNNYTTFPLPGHCPNEDTDRDGILDGGEDSNGNGQLTPGNIAVVVPGAVTTDAQGRAAFAMQYGKQYATWVRVNIMARATVAGTESKQSVLMLLPVAVSDIGDEAVPPAGVVSPFGQSANCTDAQ